MLLDLLSDAYLVFHIKINDVSCDLLVNALFISLDPKHDSMYKLQSKNSPIRGWGGLSKMSKKCP